MATPRPDALFIPIEDLSSEAEHSSLLLGQHRLVGSMGRVGAAGDNAAREALFALLQNNVLNTRRWTSQDELRMAIITWIERTYHRRRRQRARAGLTPIEIETIMGAVAT